ncbi:MAG: C4-dicarboxylate ABC transporter [Pseudomonadota bacterium]|nr:C4-dicarboxylate ABC transporter [Pseudomonadota bacterium]
MPQRPDALKYLAPNWFAIVMGLSGLSLAWGRAAPLLGDMAGGGALVLAVAAALVCVALLVLSWMRWQHYPEALAGDLKHPVRHAFIATLPVSIILLATCGVSLLGTSAWLAALWWVGSLAQFYVTLWVLSRWLNADKAQGLSWAALTPALLVPVVGNVLAPLAGVSLGAGAWSAAQFGLGLLLWPVLMALIFARIATQGLWAERLLPITFISVAPPAVIGSALLQLGGPVTLAWMCWGIALFFLLWSAQVLRRMLAQQFSVAFWSMGFPLAAFATLSARLAAQHSAAQAPAMIALALASLVIVLLLIATWKGWREGSLLQPEPVALIATAGSDQPPQPGA